MRTMEPEQLFVECSITRITIVRTRIFVVFAQVPAPRVLHLTREPVRQALIQYEIERVVRGIARIRIERDVIKLRIDPHEIFWKCAVSKEPASDTGHGRRTIEEFRKLADIAVGEERS